MMRGSKASLALIRKNVLYLIASTLALANLRKLWRQAYERSEVSL